MSTSDERERESPITSIPEEKIPKSEDSELSTAQEKESQGISQIDLKNYQFSPPGPMGWTAKEYEEMINKLKKSEGGNE